MHTCALNGIPAPFSFANVPGIWNLHCISSSEAGTLLIVFPYKKQTTGPSREKQTHASPKKLDKRC